MIRPKEIDDFEHYLKINRVVKKEEDPLQAKSLFKRGKNKFENMEKMGLDEDTATDYFENVYEASKMLIQAFMALDGFHPYSHEAIVAYAIDYLDISDKTASRLNKFRKMRHDMVYRGEIATEKEAEQLKEIFKDLLKKLESEFDL